MNFLQNIGFPIFLPIFIIVASVFAGRRRTQDARQHRTVEDYLERERLANSTRKQDISGLDYVVPDLHALPMGQADDDTLLELEETLTMLSGKKILNLSGISNTDLKMMYGPANLEALWEYDENYHTLCRTLLNYALRQEELGRLPEAIAVFEYALSLRIDMSRIYILLAKLYDRTGSPEKTGDILAVLDTMDENFRSYVLKHLESSRDGE